jgi:sugar fermentation stimulation protein A
MKFEPPLKKATLIKRYKRFLADVTLADGTITTIHVANTGAMSGCAEPGDTVWYSTSTNAKRKYPLSWELTQTQADHYICVNTIRANALAEEAIKSGIVSELTGYNKIQREVKYGNENSRIDLMLSEGDKPDAFVEVKSATLLQESQGYFPDAVTVRGQKHLRELITIVESGRRAILLFAVLHTGITSVQAAAHIDPKYAAMLDQAKASGVEVLCYLAHITPHSIELSTTKI